MRIILGALIGGITGFGIGYLGKCASGIFSLTGKAIISTVIGSLTGALIAAGKIV